MATFEKIAIVMCLVGVLVTSIFAFMTPMNGVSGYHSDSSLSSSQFSTVISSSTSAINQTNQTMNSLSDIQNRDVPSITFSLLSLIADSLFSTLKMALMMPQFLVSMAFSIFAPINAFVNVSPLIAIVGVIISLIVGMGVLRLFGVVGK